MLRPRLGWVFVLYACLCVVYISHGAEIINGKEVVPHSMPFMAYIFGHDYCGGTLISPNWVLTAAHCKNMKTVWLGAHNINRMEYSRQIRKVKRSIPHHSFNEHNLDNDLMLIELDKPAMVTEAVKILPLSKHVVYPAAGSTCVVAGWGNTKYKGTGSNVLLSVKVTVIDWNKCNSRNYYNFHPFINPDQICAGSDGTNNVGSCHGDSGGPLLCNGKVVGVTSFGIECGLINKPGVYGFLSPKQLDWIKRTTGIRDI